MNDAVASIQLWLNNRLIDETRQRYVAGCQLLIAHRTIKLPVKSDSHAQVNGLFVVTNLPLKILFKVNSLALRDS